MAIKIIGVTSKSSSPISDPIEAHLAMDKFSWIDEASQKRGETERDVMYDWIVNKGGKAFIKKDVTGQIVYIFGALSNGKKYIRTAEDKRWTDGLIDLQKSAARPPDPS